MLTPRCNQSFIPCNPYNAQQRFDHKKDLHTWPPYTLISTQNMHLLFYKKIIYIYIYNAKKFPSIIVRYKSCYVHDYTFFVHSLISRWLCVYMISIIQQKYLTYFHATSFSCPIFQFLVTSYKLKSWISYL